MLRQWGCRSMLSSAPLSSVAAAAAAATAAVVVGGAIVVVICVCVLVRSSRGKKRARGIQRHKA